MKNFFNFLVSTLLVLSCTPNSAGGTPEWPWTDPDTPPAAAEPNPAVVEKGWTNVSASYTLPEGLQVYKSPSSLQGVKAVAYLAVADPSKIAWDVWSIDDPETKGTDDALKTPSEVFATTSAPLIVNGGYFFVEGGKQYNASVAYSGGKRYGVNLNYASQDWKTYYYPTRGVFYQAEGKTLCGWTYYTTSGQHYLYGKPAPNSWDKAPQPAPDANYPEKAAVFAPTTAIGAGPVLLHNAEVADSWEAELFYGNGADDKMPKDRHPRTAIGSSASRLFLFVCEGRQMTEGVPGLTTAEVARVLKEVGCTEALNLDGGGSTCMLVGGKSTIRESDGKQRSVGSAIILKKK